MFTLCINDVYKIRVRGFHYANKGGRSENIKNHVMEKGNFTEIILLKYVHAWMLFKMRPAPMAFCS